MWLCIIYLWCLMYILQLVITHSAVHDGILQHAVLHQLGPELCQTEVVHPRHQGWCSTKCDQLLHGRGFQSHRNLQSLDKLVLILWGKHCGVETMLCATFSRRHRQWWRDLCRWCARLLSMSAMFHVSVQCWDELWCSGWFLKHLKTLLWPVSYTHLTLPTKRIV